jgi:hypothetical protein
MEWIESKSLEERARMVTKEGVTETNPGSEKLWQHGNSLADNMRILSHKCPSNQ